MKWTNNNLIQLQNWATSFSAGDEITVPDFLAYIAITQYQKILKEKQGEMLHNGHYTDEVLDEVLAKCFKNN